MNRATKRLLAKQQAATEKDRGKMAQAQVAAKRRVEGEPQEGRIRRSRRFLKEVRQELKRVAWPSRGEVLVYTIVVLISVTVVTLYVFGLDFAFANGVLHFFKS